MRSLTLFEKQAARIVAACSNCLLEQLDPGGGSEQLPDFELRNSRHERIGVLEVTSTVDREFAAFDSARAKHRISDGRLRFDWLLVARTADVNFKLLQKELPGLLFDAEQKGLVSQSPNELLPGHNFVVGAEPQTSLIKCGIRMWSALPAVNGMPGSARITPPARGGSLAPGMVTEAVEAELQRADNLTKLATAKDGERAELFVWLDVGRAAMALVTPQLFPMFDSSYPTNGPKLPPSVTQVWAATGPNDQDVLARALWVAEGGNWRVLPSPPRLA